MKTVTECLREVREEAEAEKEARIGNKKWKNILIIFETEVGKFRKEIEARDEKEALEIVDNLLFNSHIKVNLYSDLTENYHLITNKVINFKFIGF